jgi:hypothetical protein
VSPAVAAPARPGYVKTASAVKGRKVIAKLHKRGWRKKKLASARKAKRKALGPAPRYPEYDRSCSILKHQSTDEPGAATQSAVIGSPLRTARVSVRFTAM